ncbi:hypothetical protein PybrP1_007872, partial [[Pythium] brassicae (nom. inval.)]
PWGAFFTTASPASRASAAPPVSGIPTPEKVFSQNVDILLREAAARIKVVISTMLESAEFGDDLRHLSGFVALAADKLQQNGDPALVVLKNYFASAAGSQLCEQTAFPSLVLDFLGKFRVVLVKEELSRMEEQRSVTPEMERAVEFLMACVHAIALNGALMETFRCEIPNLIQFSAEEYPPSALFLRDLSSQALAAVPDKNFNAGLVWYLHDCGIIGKLVKVVAKHTGAAVTTVDTAAVGAFCLPSYDPLPGIKSLVFVLQKTCRHSMVLLGEFQASGGYALLTRLLMTCSEKDMSTLLYLFTLLLPLGTGFSGACGSDENMATIITCGARNVGAFLALRDLLMKCISELEILSDGQLSDAAKVRDEQLILQLLTTILHVYTSDYDNFLRLEPKTQTLALVLTKLPWIAFYDAKVIVLRIVEYVCATTTPDSSLPTELLSILCSLFIEYTASETASLLSVPSPNDSDRDRGGDSNDLSNTGPKSSTFEPSSANVADHSLALLLCSCIIKILQNSSLQGYRDELNNFGLLERGVYAFFVKISNALAALADAGVSTKRAYLARINFYLSMWATLAARMLKNNWQLCVGFRELQIHQSLYPVAEALVDVDLISEIPRLPDFRGCYSALSIFAVFIELATFKASAAQADVDDDAASSRSKDEFSLLQSGIESDLSKILELLQACRGSVPRQCLLLSVLREVLKGKDLVWCAWKSCQGHETLIAILSSIDDLRVDGGGSKFAMMDAILGILCAILDPVSGDEATRSHFQAEVGHSAIAMCLLNSGVIQTQHLPSVLNRVFELITGTAPPRNKIRCADAVQTLFCLLPNFETGTAVAALNRLLLKLTSNDEFSFSRRKQAAMLVQAGVFAWLAKPAIVRLFVDDTPLRAPLTALIMVLSSEELPTSRLREFLRVVAKGMPLLLGNAYHPSVRAPAPSARESAEIGLLLLEKVFKSPRVPQVLVGTHVKARMASGYMHIVNSTDRSTASGAAEGSTVSVALCEGHITITLDGDDAATNECYCVLVGPLLTFFASCDAATRNESPVKTLDITAVACNGSVDFYFWSHEKRFLAKCRSADDAEMWLKAMQQSESISNIAVRNRGALADPTSDDEILFVSEAPSPVSAAEPSTAREALEGYVCILSVYSVESSGCFVRIYFEQATGCLRVDTGSVSSGPTINPNPKRTSATFKNIDMNLLRAAPHAAPSARGDDALAAGSSDHSEEDGSHWHHIALTHRKTVVGSSLLTLYVDGSEVTTKKLSYPSAPAAGPMQAFVGKDIQVCGTFPALPWSIGPAWFTEDVLSATAVACMFLMGPSFSGQFSGHAYRSAGDWPEAHASSQLNRATQRRVDIARFAKRLQLAKLGRVSRRQWSEPSGFGVNALVAAASDFSAAVEANAKKEDGGDGLRFPTGAAPGVTRKEQAKVEAFTHFVQADCAMSTFGSEILRVLGSFKLAESLVIFSLNTKASAPLKATPPQHPHIQFVGTERSWPLDLPKALPSVGGVTQLLLPLLENAWRSTELSIVLSVLAHAMRQNPSSLAECLEMNGYALIAGMLTERIELVDERVLEAAVRLAIAGDLHSSAVAGGADGAASSARLEPHSAGSRLSLVVDATALAQIVLSHELRRQLPWQRQSQIVVSLLDVLDAGNPNALFNARQLRRAGLLSWILLYASDLCNEECSLEKRASLEHRWCFPAFAYEGYNELLQRLLCLLRTYLHVESHVNDVSAIADMLLLSLTSDAVHRRESPFRVVLLQFLLHEIESDSEAAPRSPSPSSSPASAFERTDLLSPTIVDAVLYRSVISSGTSKKRKDRQADATAGGGSGSGGILSPTAGTSSAASPSLASLPVDGVETVLLEIIARTESGSFASMEALLALRILLSLAQSYAAFAQYLLQSPTSAFLAFKRALQSSSLDGNAYIPMLAYVSNIPIKDAKYCDAVGSPGARRQQYALPAPCAFLSPERFCVDQVWELLGSMLLRNCEARCAQAKVITVAVLSQLSFQAEVSESFFAAVCSSSSVVLRTVVQCLLYQPRPANEQEAADDKPVAHGAALDDTERVSKEGDPPRTLQQLLGFHISRRAPESFAGEVASACFDLLRVVAARSLFEKDEFASLMMFLLECLDDGARRQRATTAPLPPPFALADAQKCWLALLVHTVKSTQALSEHCSLVVLRNLCTVGVALSRYLVDESKHQGALTGSSAASPSDPPEQASSPSRVESLSASSTGAFAATSCFGTDVLAFFLSSIRMCSETAIIHLVGAEDQQFVYGCLVYCAQTVALNELNGFHRGATPPQRLLDCIVSSKHLLLQQTKCSSVIVCGTLSSHHAGGTDAGPGGAASASSSVAPPSQGGFSGRLNRMRSLSASAHKEFGIGAESDRSFILSLTASLFRLLMDDAASVRHASILVWQFLIQQRMGVLKELLIVEPRVSLLQNITTNKKEAIDVFHGGFERLLHVLPTRVGSVASGAFAGAGFAPDGHVGGASADSSRESWLQFHHWLTENLDLLKDLILVRTEPIYQHLTEVLQSCLSVRKVNTTSSATKLLPQPECALHVDFALCFDAEQSGASVGVGSASGEDNDAAARYRAAARKTVFKLSNMRESSMDAMVDAQARWRETLLQLLHTRSVWQQEGWKASVGTDRRVLQRTSSRSAAAVTETAQSFYLERSIFQQNAFKQRLDYSEGPQRMRVRLVRSYDTWDSEPAGKETADDASSGLDVTAQPDDVVSQVLSSVVLATAAATAAASGDREPLVEFEDDDDDGAVALQGDVKSDDDDGDESDDDGLDRVGGESGGGAVASRLQEKAAAASNGGERGAEKEVGSDGDQDEDDGDAPTATPDKIGSDSDSKIFDSSYDYVYGGVARFLQRADHPPLRCYGAAYIAGMDKVEGIFLVCRHALYFLGGYEKLFYQVSDVDASASGGMKGGVANPLSPTAGATGGGSSGYGDSNMVSSHQQLSPGRAGVSEKSGGALPGTTMTGDGSAGVSSKKKARNLIRSTLADLSNQFSPSKSASSQLFTVVPLQPATFSVPGSAPTSSDTVATKRWSIRYANVKQFSRIKYQLRPVGIEFFDTFGSTYFLHFESHGEREEIIKLIFQMPIVNSIFWHPLLRASALSLSMKRIRQALTKRWLRGAVSNFEYLMHLNTLAGRSFNDITQYPVFPWVVADYKSDFLDLDDPATFRDLSKPMGALGAHRAAQFRERYHAMSEGGPGPFDSPAFHYGTHYSCSAYVVNYLIRLEPFTRLALELQGGSFDHADRLFCNIPASWKSASSDNLQDVRELIPEFFYLPEFLYNSNDYNFGTTQGGDAVSHVRLPPWAHGDPREFIRVHRRALESKCVSESLHQWIDLIFGVKQTGSAALEAQNVFMHVTYEGTVDIDQIADPVMRNATLSQIENFGQTPSRIFSSPHPQRRVPALLSPPSAAAASAAIGHQYEGNTLSSIEAFVKWHTPLAPALVAIGKDYVFLKRALAAKALDEPVGDVRLAGSDKFQCRGVQCTFAPPRFTKYAEWGSAADGTIRFRVHQSSARHREANKVVGVVEGAHYCGVKCAAFSDDGRLFATGGQDGVVNVLECSKKSGQRIFKQFAKLVGHEDAVESVAIDKEFSLIVSGSADCCAILWDLRTRVFLRELVGHSSPVTKIAINSATGSVLTATAAEVRVWSINGDLLAAASVASCGLSAVTAAIATRCEMWQDGAVAVTGHSNGTIALWGLSYPSDIERERRAKAVVRKVVPSCQLFIMKLLLDHRAAVTALTLGADQRQLLSGDAEGNCIRWVDDSQLGDGTALSCSSSTAVVSPTLIVENDLDTATPALPLLLVRGPRDSGFPTLVSESQQDFAAIAARRAQQVVAIPIDTACSFASALQDCF